MVLSEELCILANCLLSPMSRNSVLEELRVERLAVIQEDICICCIEHFEGGQCLSQSQVDERRRVECHLHKGGGG